MDIYPSDSIFSELKSVHETGYYDAQLSLEDRWQQVPYLEILVLYILCTLNPYAPPMTFSASLLSMGHENPF